MVPILYSIQTYLAYYINVTYYDNTHFAWCAPEFDCFLNSSLAPNQAYTSNPKSILEEFLKEIKYNDTHMSRTAIEHNVMGLIRGANKMLLSHKITIKQRKDILKKIKECQENNYQDYFRPLIYIIPTKNNDIKIEIVPVKHRALPLSEEYIVKGIKTDSVGIIDLVRSNVI